MAIDKSGKTLIAYNVKNGQFAINNEIKPLTWLTRFAKEKNLTTKQIFGDGELQLTLVNDKGYTGTIGMTTIDIDYNKALGFGLDIDGGYAEVKQTAVIEHAIYFETEYVDKTGVSKIKKTWAFGVTTEAPSETFEQTTDDINESNVEYSITIKGIPLKDSTGLADYVDPSTGQTVKCFLYSKIPTDEGYATFGDTVPTPKMSE